MLITAGYCGIVPVVNSIAVLLLLQVLPGLATGLLFLYTTSEAMKGIPAT